MRYVCELSRLVYGFYTFTKMWKYVYTYFSVEMPANNCNLPHWKLTHPGRETYIYIFSTPTINGLDNGLPPDLLRALVWANARILLIRPLGKNFSEILMETLSGKCIWKVVWKITVILSRSQCVNYLAFPHSQSHACWLPEPRIRQSVAVVLNTFPGQFRLRHWV